MRLPFLLLVASCAITARPVDIIRPAPIYCEPITEDHVDCRDANMVLWHCQWYSEVGRWRCWSTEE